jgi:hypothetical protein
MEVKIHTFQTSAWMEVRGLRAPFVSFPWTGCSAPTGGWTSCPYRDRTLHRPVRN